MKKKILSWLLVIVMVLGLFPVTAFAAETSAPIAVTSDDNTVDVTYQGTFGSKQYNSGTPIPVYYAKVSESATVNISCLDGAYVPYNPNNYYLGYDYDLVGLNKTSLEAYFTDAASYDLDTENSVAYIELATDDYFYTSTCGLLIELIPESDEPAVQSVDVYFSVSYDENYTVCDETGTVVALKQLEVPYFDLAPYDLEDFDNNNSEEVTMLHLFLYATEIYRYGLTTEEAGQGYLYEEEILGTEELTINGTPGSMFLQEFWNIGYNLNYYLNYEYPMASEGWGATADQIVLKDGDVVTIGGFTSWNFFSDPTSVFNFIKAGEDVVKTTAQKGDQVTMTLYHAGAGENSATAHNPVTTSPNVYYAPFNDVTNGNVTEWTLLGSADENGNILVDTAKLKAGEYLIAMAGQYGLTYTNEICSTPGAIILTIAGTSTDDSDQPAEPEIQGVTRIFGEGRIDTAFEIAETLKTALDIEKFETVIIATSKNFADALPGSYLAYVENAPILLVSEARMADVVDYVKANLTENGKVYILGGTAAVPAKLDDMLKDYDVKRLAGGSRYDTNLMILEEANVAGSEIIVATGREFADSLSVSAVKLPILLVKDQLNERQKTFLEEANAEKFYIAGGEAAVNKTVEEELDAYGAVERIAGANRRETSVKIAEKFFDHPKAAVVASARNFPDGLCGGPLAAALDAPLLLTVNGNSAEAEQYADAIDAGYVLGGKEVMEDQTVMNIFDLESADDIITK